MGATVLIAGPAIHEAGVERLRAAGCRVLHLPAGTAAEAARLMAAEGVEAVVSRSVPLDRAAIEAAPRLRVISKHGVGYDNVDVAAATRRGIPVLVARGANSQAVAELAIGLLIAAARNLAFHDASLRAGRWTRHVHGMELAGRILGIVGVGAVGSRVAPIARAIGMRVVAHDPLLPAARRPEGIAFLPALRDLLAQADAVTLHCPLTAETRGMIDAAAIAAMRPGALLVNTARGEVVQEAALVAALRDGRLAAAGLDVHAGEPLPADSPLLTLPNVVLTPHIGGSSAESAARVALRCAENALAVLEGRAVDPEDVVNREALSFRLAC